MATFPSDPPTFTMEPVPGRPGVVRPVLSKPIWIDPETGTVRWDDGPDGRAVPGWEGSTGPFPHQYNEPHVYARDVYSGAGNCVCGRALGEARHVQAAPGVDVPDRMRV